MTQDEAYQISREIVRTLATGVLMFAAVDAFGLLRGFGIWAAVWLLSPYAPRSK